MILQNARKKIDPGNSEYLKNKIHPLLVGSILPEMRGRKLSALLMISDKLNWFLFILPLNWYLSTL